MLAPASGKILLLTLSPPAHLTYAVVLHTVADVRVHGGMQAGILDATVIATFGNWASFSDCVHNNKKTGCKYSNNRCKARPQSSTLCICRSVLWISGDQVLLPAARWQDTWIRILDQDCPVSVYGYQISFFRYICMRTSSFDWNRYSDRLLNGSFQPGSWTTT